MRSTHFASKTDTSNLYAASAHRPLTPPLSLPPIEPTRSMPALDETLSNVAIVLKPRDRVGETVITKAQRVRVNYNTLDGWDNNVAFDNLIVSAAVRARRCLIIRGSFQCWKCPCAESGSHGDHGCTGTTVQSDQVLSHSTSIEAPAIFFWPLSLHRWSLISRPLLLGFSYTSPPRPCYPQLVL